MDVVETIVESDEFHGCIFVNAAMEFPPPREPAHAAAARNKQAIEDIVFEIASRSQAADPRQPARELCLVIEGAYVTRHVTGNPQTKSIARRVADAAISSSESASPKQPAGRDALY